MAYKGVYKPSYPKKYIGNPNNIIYRSLWERKFCRYCDNTPSILEWGSEEMFVWYMSPIDKKPHRYFPDFYIKVQEANGKVKKYIIEIKPQRQTLPPEKPKRQSRGYLREVYEYARNQAKWEAAKEWCLDRGFEFKVFTEKELGIK